MKKIVETSNFNIGKYLDCIYQYLALSTTKADYVNSLISVFLEEKAHGYEIDKASVSKLSTHKYDLRRSIKMAIASADESLMDSFLSALLCDAPVSLEEVAICVADKFEECEKNGSSAVTAIQTLFKKKKYKHLLFFLFKFAASSPNQPCKEKAKPGRKKKGSFQSVFFLSEEEKLFEIEKLRMKLFRVNDHLTKNDFELMKELMAFANLSFTLDEKKIVAKRFLKHWLKENGPSAAEDFLHELACCHKAYEKKESFLGWEKAVEEATARLALEPLSTVYRKAIRQNSFAEARRVIDALSINEYVLSSGEIRPILLENRFFLPDFSGHITESLWGYCLGMARLAKEVNCVSEFDSLLKEIENSSSRTSTIADRINVLRAKAGI